MATVYSLTPKLYYVPFLTFAVTRPYFLLISIRGFCGGAEVDCHLLSQGLGRMDGSYIELLLFMFRYINIYYIYDISYMW